MKKGLLFLSIILAFSVFSCGVLMTDSEYINNSYDIPKGVMPEIDSDTVGVVWNQNAADTNIDLTFTGSQDGSQILDPCVVKKGDTYHMWFTGVQNLGSLGLYYKIRYVRSNDGINWSNPNPFNDILAPTISADATADTHGVRVGTVIYDAEEDEFKMWYRGRHSTENRWKYFYASSKYPDKGWLKYPNNQNETGLMPVAILDEGEKFDRRLGDLSVIKERYYDGLNYYSFYKMWYTGLGDKDLLALEDTWQYRINYATSSDGINWTKESKPVLSPIADRFDSGGKDMPAVIKDLKNNVYIYKLWYLGKAANTDTEVFPGVAYSISGRKFTYHLSSYYDESNSDDHFLTESPEKIQDPWVIRDGYVYKMWYVDNSKKCISFIESW